VLLATGLANVFRQDLLNAGIGNGVHGFAYTPPFTVSSSHTVTARPRGSSLSLSGTPKSVTCPELSARAERPVRRLGRGFLSSRPEAR
jgi:hypothetical protein